MRRQPAQSVAEWGGAEPRTQFEMLLNRLSCLTSRIMLISLCGRKVELDTENDATRDGETIDHSQYSQAYISHAILSKSPKRRVMSRLRLSLKNPRGISLS